MFGDPIEVYRLTAKAGGSQAATSPPKFQERQRMQVGMGMGASSYFEQPRNTDFTIVVSGSDCTPCVALKPPKLNTMQALPSSRLRDGITEAWAGPVRLPLRRTGHESRKLKGPTAHVGRWALSPVYHFPFVRTVLF